MEAHGKPPRASRVSVSQLMLPEHANAWGKVHGGLIMKLVDECGGIAAMRHAQRPCVTVAIDSMTFQSAVEVGQVLCCDALITYVGRTAIEITVEVHAEDPIAGCVTHTNTAQVVYVAIDDAGRPTRVPDLLLETDEDRARWETGKQRQEARVAARKQAKRAGR
ncbi:MAG: acyl-CoA thioesterase [Polyangiaceae bacterium]|nr:acyl-CoA thioesterase [Polyangiaceae bacterium]MCW5789266.1 acyl-CoA thioesterase [Polyangiaceae bacterium]